LLVGTFQKLWRGKYPPRCLESDCLRARSHNLIARSVRVYTAQNVVWYIEVGPEE